MFDDDLMTKEELIKELDICIKQDGHDIYLKADNAKMVKDMLDLHVDADVIGANRMEVGKLTEDAAIRLLQESGWMEKHDKEITESEYKRGYEDGGKHDEGDN